MTVLHKLVIGLLFALLFITSVLLFTESASACTLPPNTYAYPGECVVYNLDGTKYEEPKNTPEPKEEPQVENQDEQPRHSPRHSYSNYYWTPFSYGYGHYPFGHHYYPQYSLGLHLGFGHHFGHFGHHRSHH